MSTVEMLRVQVETHTSRRQRRWSLPPISRRPSEAHEDDVPASPLPWSLILVRGRQPVSLSLRELGFSKCSASISHLIQLLVVSLQAVSVDAFVDGFLIGLSYVANYQAGFVMAGATCVEMGFVACLADPFFFSVSTQHSS